jgi:hypothetical protein
MSSTKSKNKIAEQVLPGVCRGREVVQVMYTHARKCKNNKIKLKKRGHALFLSLMVSDLKYE